MHLISGSAQRSASEDTIGAVAAWQMILDLRHGRHIDAIKDSITIAADGGWQSYQHISEEARQLFDIYLPIVSRGPDQSLVLAQMGQSLDGRIATSSGSNECINGPAGLIHLHRLRALVDAVVIGAGTAVADDPLLTVRHVTGESPVRVVIDPAGRVPRSIRLFNDPRVRTLQLCAHSADSVSATEVLSLAAGSARCSAGDVLDLLASMGYRRVLIEGGGTTVSRFLQAGVLDRIHLTVAPMILGSGKPAFSLAEITSIDHAVRARTRRFSLDQDTLFDLELRPVTPARTSSNPGKLQSRFSKP